MTTIALLSLLVGIVGHWLFGIALAALLSGRHQRPPFAELAGLGCLLGVGATAWLLFIVSSCGVPLGLVLSGVLAVVGALAGGITLWQRRRQSRPIDLATPGTTDNPDGYAFALAAQWVVALLCFASFVQILLTPQKLWDERAAFALKARVLFEDDSVNSPTLRHSDFVQYHPRYPLLLPLAEADLYALWGSVDDRLAKLVFPLLYSGMVLTVAGVLLRHVSRAAAWLAALLVATIPVLMPYEYGFLCGQADAPMASFHTVSVLYLWDGLQRSRRGETAWQAFVLAGLLGSLAAFTKDEGIAYLMVDGGILALFAIASCRSWLPLRQLFLLAATYTITASIILVPWFLHRRSLPTTTEMNYFDRMSVSLFMNRLNTLNWSGPHLLHRMFSEWREWGLQWWLMLGAFLGRPGRAFQRPQTLLILDIIGALASLLVAGMVAPAQLDEHIGGSSHRFLMQIAPVAVLFAITQFTEASPDRGAHES